MGLAYCCVFAYFDFHLQLCYVADLLTADQTIPVFFIIGLDYISDIISMNENWDEF